MVIQLVGLRELRRVRAIVRALKKGDIEFIDKAFQDAPEEVREKIKRILGAYKEAEEGKVDVDVAIRAIAAEIGLENVETVYDAIELVKDLVE